jgi:hypothetical protein
VTALKRVGLGVVLSAAMILSVFGLELAQGFVDEDVINILQIFAFCAWVWPFYDYVISPKEA